MLRINSSGCFQKFNLPTNQIFIDEVEFVSKFIIIKLLVHFEEHFRMFKKYIRM